MVRVYCAGPLFTDYERAEMAEIARVLEAAGHTTYLPHRDGLEMAKLAPLITKQTNSENITNKILQQAIFTLDLFHLHASQTIVVNLNGRVPDEGAVVEAALGFFSDKPVVLYKADPRTLLHGSDNPMILGLSALPLVTSIAQIPAAVEEAIYQARQGYSAKMLSLGQSIAAHLREKVSADDKAMCLLQLLGHFHDYQPTA